MARSGWKQWLAGMALAVVGTPLCAQGLLLPAGDPAADELPRVVPIWSNDSGRVEALLLIDDPLAAPPISSPLDALLPAPTPGLRGLAQLTRNIDLNVDLQAGPSTGMALLCDGNIGLAVALGRLAESCLLAQLESSPLAGFGERQQRAGVSLDWHSEDGALDLSFGLSWLDARPAMPARLSMLPSLVDPSTLGGAGALGFALAPSELRAHEFSLHGQTWLSPRSWLRVDGRHGSSRLTGNFGLPIEFDSTALSVSGGHRAFSGTVTGRIIELNQPRHSWADVDIAFSWRTPWDARVSVGARNLLGGPDREKWPLATLPGLQESEARTPYVRYHQDL